MPDASEHRGINAAKTLLRQIEDQRLNLEELMELSVDLARHLLQACEANATRRDREQADVLGRMMHDQRGQTFTTLLTDRAYRSRSLKRTVEQARYLLEKIGPPAYLGTLERLELGALRRLGTWLPTLSGTAMLNRIEEETSAFILPAGRELDVYLDKRKAEGVRVNVNHLGEEVLSEAEAEARVEHYIELLRRPGIDVLSVKISSICSQLTPFAHAAGLQVAVERLRRVYRAALAHRTEAGGPKLVSLDMESYQDARLTLDTFKQVLSEPEFISLHAGIALQAYLPDTVAWHRDLLRWAERRVQNGGAPIRTRLVKGANLETERVTSSIAGWPCPIYPTKLDVDANYKRLLLEACNPEHAQAANVGVASHNLFDVCFALLLRSSEGSSRHVSFELLEGMADPLRRTLMQLGVEVLVYAPVVHEHEFPSAIAYLVRRLDENTSPENYLRHSFSMRYGTEGWDRESRRFREACAHVRDVSELPRRTQDRRRPSQASPLNAAFRNEPDTDFSQPHNREHFDAWLRQVHDTRYRVQSVIAGTTRSGETAPGFDPSRPRHVPYEIELAGEAQIEEALDCASRCSKRAPTDTAEVPGDARRQWLAAAANALRNARAELVAIMVLDAGKRVEEADTEVSEAIDFAEYYLRCQRELEESSDALARPKGVCVITPPWNFPLAIPLGGVFAALVAGNAAILKPALETPLVAQRAVELLWEAGVPKERLQFVVCRDEVASRLITDERTSLVVLTGATSTARKFLEMRPDLDLLAETGGKNAMYISAMSDHEQAVADALASAFGHAGQKCSALSQLILDAELYESAEFRTLLASATQSLRVGSAWDPAARVTPMIHPPNELQLRALTRLEPGESWLIEPRIDPDNPRLVSPGIKFGVAPGSFTHVTEFFCPMLAVLRAADVQQAVEIANMTQYGLTAGIHSLDEREHELFIDGIQAGNVYVNRRITGAVVQRQPFGGWKQSNFGPGAKAGGPNYVRQFVRLASPQVPRLAAVAEPTLTPRVRQWLQAVSSIVSGDTLRELEAQAEEFEAGHTRWFTSPYDASGVRGEDNLLRYRPLRKLLLIANATTNVPELARRLLAALVAECPLELVATPDCPGRELVQASGGRVVEPGQLVNIVENSTAERAMLTGDVPAPLLRAMHERGMYWHREPPLPVARWELPRYLREQSVSVLYHRYGHLGLRHADE